MILRAVTLAFLAAVAVLLACGPASEPRSPYSRSDALGMTGFKSTAASVQRLEEGSLAEVTLDVRQGRDLYHRCKIPVLGRPTAHDAFGTLLAIGVPTDQSKAFYQPEFSSSTFSARYEFYLFAPITGTYSVRLIGEDCIRTDDTVDATVDWMVYPR